jgi:hypothetical protein
MWELIESGTIEGKGVFALQLRLELRRPYFRIVLQSKENAYIIIDQVGNATVAGNLFAAIMNAFETREQLLADEQANLQPEAAGLEIEHGSDN